MTLTIGSLFSGYGGLDMAVETVTGGRTVWHCEYEPPTDKVPNPKQAGARLLAYRWPGVPNHGDVTAVDWAAVQPVDVLCGGSPCQDVSSAGKRAGMRAGTRSGLWASFVDAIATIRPRLVVWENVRGVLSAEADSALEPCPGCVGGGDDGPVLRALGRVLGDLAELGYDASWHGLRAADIGAPHGRFRVFVVAWPAADANCDVLRQQPVARTERRRASLAGLAGPDALTHPEGDGRDEGRTEPARLIGGSHVAERRDAPAADAERGRRNGRSPQQVREPQQRAAVAWGGYEPAVRRWERLTRPAPLPWEQGARDGYRLAPAFSEWMMGLPAGHVTDVPGLTRNEQLKLIGNGVVPQQGAVGITRALEAAPAWVRTALAEGVAA